jgi:heat shock protein 1/8
MTTVTKGILDNLYSDSDDDFDDYFGNSKCNGVDGNVTDVNSDSDEFTDDKIEVEAEEELIIGIDLGTTNSCVSIWRKNNLEIIPDSYGNRTIPSIVSFTNVSKYVGNSAKNQKDINPENTYYEVKRLIGRKYKDHLVQSDLPFLTYKVGGDDKTGNVILESGLDSRKKKITPEEISAYVLMELKYMAENYLKKTVEKAVITVPAYFNDSQRQATKDAATIAGLDCVRIINEPTAAALSYGMQRLSKNKEEEINVIVYDCGGGTLDVSLLNISDGLFEVLGCAGNTHLGGADFDNRLINYCKNKFKVKNKISRLSNLSLLSLQKLKKTCEGAKKMLSETWKATILVPNFYDGIDLRVKITRVEFEKLCRDLLIMCIKPIEDVLKLGDMERDDVDEIILVGGLTRMPAIRNNIKLFFRGKEPNCTVNPDEVVSAGAAIQGYILGSKKDPFAETLVLLDVIPLSLGVETLGGVMTTIVPRNSVIPFKRKKKFTTYEDYVDSLEIKVFEGERTMTKDNFSVGEFTLNGIKKEPRGIPEISVVFKIDINGIVSITAEDKKNNDNKKTINITGNKGRLSGDDITKLVAEAQEMEKKDRLEREKRQVYIDIENMCSNVKYNVNNDEFKLKDADKMHVLTEIEKIFAWLGEKPYLERNITDYNKVLNRLNKKYGTLILRMSTDNSTIKESNVGTGEGTTIYGNEDDDEEEIRQLYEKIENDEFGFDECMEQEARNEVKELRSNLTDLCYSIFGILNSKSLKIKNSDIKELRDYVDDVLLWTHVIDKIPKSDYIQKIDEVNKICDDLFNKYDNNIFEENQIISQMVTKKNELEQLCYALKSSIMSNLFSMEEDRIKTLDKKIDDTLEWLINIEVEAKKAEFNNEEFKIEEKDYQEKIDSINELCNDLYNNMLGINTYGSNDDILDNGSVIYIDNDGQGTTLDTLYDLEEVDVGGFGEDVDDVVVDDDVDDIDDVVVDDDVDDIIVNGVSDNVVVSETDDANDEVGNIAVSETYHINDEVDEVDEVDDVNDIC